MSERERERERETDRQTERRLVNRKNDREEKEFSQNVETLKLLHLGGK